MCLYNKNKVGNSDINIDFISVYWSNLIFKIIEVILPTDLQNKKKL